MINVFREAQTARHTKPKGGDVADKPQMLTREEVARRLRVSLRYVTGLLTTGELVGTRVGRRVLVSITEFDRYLKTLPPTTAPRKARR